MSENRISLEFTDEKKERIRQAALNLIRELAQDLIALEPEDKKALFKMSDRSIPFVEKALEYMQTDPQFIPGYVDGAEAVRDHDLFNFLRSLFRLVEPLMQNIDDTATLAGSDTMRAANAFYNSVREAAKMGVPRAQTIYEDLSQRYDAQKARIKQPAPQP